LTEQPAVNAIIPQAPWLTAFTGQLSLYCVTKTAHLAFPKYLDTL